ncbi:TetR/AcrR family transcriptional regulator [Piscinibacter sakaiensis]|uniref:Transcriptional regulator, TetR family n=1 Tax=Piscinibacter sakaiensis TaxID=1547922 RepID=A0A0K8NXT9_PISS1|nr:TetR/AcrR family transcriptional regulator [Piscinibacter sakaiensis]GAP34745.1 transcriptional regulator, TetR family [Piscinibacter sakaiensis]
MARPRSADYALNRDTIVRTAARLFAERGYPGTSMSDLARACGISKPLLYHYVDDKYRLLHEIAEGHVARLVALVDAVEAEDLAPEPRLRRLIERFVEEYGHARDDHGVLTQDVRFLADADRERVLTLERRVVEAFARTIAEVRPALGGAAALHKPLTMLLFGMMNWMFKWLRPDGRLAPRELAPVVAELFLGGLGAVPLGDAGTAPAARPAVLEIPPRAAPSALR